MIVDNNWEKSEVFNEKELKTGVNLNYILALTHRIRMTTINNKTRVRYTFLRDECNRL